MLVCPLMLRPFNYMRREGVQLKSIKGYYSSEPASEELSSARPMSCPDRCAHSNDTSVSQSCEECRQSDKRERERAGERQRVTTDCELTSESQVIGSQLRMCTTNWLSALPFEGSPIGRLIETSISWLPSLNKSTSASLLALSSK